MDIRFKVIMLSVYFFVLIELIDGIILVRLANQREE